MAQALILVLLPYGPLRQWLFYTMRQVSILGCLACAFRRYRSNRDEIFQQRMVKRRPLFLVLLVFTLCIVCEDTYLILLAPIPASNSPLTGVFLSSRNISENLMMIFIAAVTIYQTVRDLEIASELILAEGTIKTHLHNIMKKCGQSNRGDLKKDFWRS